MNFRFLIIFFSSILFFSACKKEGCTDSTAINYDSEAKKNSGCVYERILTIKEPVIISDSAMNTGEIEIRIVPKANDRRFYLNEVYRENNDRRFRINKFKYFVSNVKLGDKSIVKANITDIELIDYDTSSFLSETRPIYDHIIDGKIKAGMYNRVFLGCGVDPIWNEEYAPNDYPTDHPLNTTYTNMAWTWETKYIFTSIEGEIDSDGDNTYDRSFFMHTGFNELYSQVILPIGEFEVKEDSKTIINLELDIIKVFAGLDIATKEGQTHSSGAEQLEYSRTIQTNLANNIKFVGVTYE